MSRALSKPGRVSAKTQKLIEDAAAELNYQVNPFARALPTGRTSTFGLIVADITNPTFFDIIRGAETTATARDYTLVLAESAESAATELTAARRMMATVDGLILASPRMDDDNIRALARDKPVVVINREVDGVPCVVPDVNKGISEAVRSLAANGHHKGCLCCRARRSPGCPPAAGRACRRPASGPGWTPCGSNPANPRSTAAGRWRATSGPAGPRPC